MEYDYGRSQGQGGYESSGMRPVYGRTSSNNNAQASSNFAHYPRIGHAAGAPGSPITRAPPPPPPVSNPSFPSGAAIRVAVKPMYQVAPPPQLRMQSREVPRSLFQFDFDLERRILAEAEVQGNPHLRASSKSQANGDDNLAEVVEDATVAKYLAMGHTKEAVQYALQNFGDDQTKILDFCPAFYKIRDMGFPADRVARALAQHNNDEEQAAIALVGG